MWVSVTAVKSSEELTALFRAREMRVTPQRQAIFAILGESDRHLTAEAVFETARRQMPTISLRTVYQTLNDLAAMGELTQLHLGPGSSRFDPNTDPHHHLVCESCGEVVDLHADLTDVRVPDDVVAGFRITSTEVVFRGRCTACVAAGSDNQLQQPQYQK
jgi:Fur family peroxide stress response transcriptional regulator